MQWPRFYPTVLAMPDGRQLIIGGQGEFCGYITIMEIFDSTKGLSRVRGPSRLMRDYPRAFLLSDGSVAQVLPESRTALLGPDRKSWDVITGTRLGEFRFEAAGFYVPGRTDSLMICGGYTEHTGVGFKSPTETCERIDFSDASPRWTPVRSMRYARGDINAVLLPDGKVLIVGGGEHHRYDGPNLRPEIYDPATDSWTLAAPQRFGRMYHSTAVLLPDGRVLSAGQDDGDEDGLVSGYWGEIYEPPYLFHGKRPKVRSAPDAVLYDELVQIKVKKAKRIRSVVLIGLSAVTHSTNVGQRYVPLEFDLRGRSKLDVRVTRNPNLAPPGYYLLFLVNDKGVPSVAEMVRLDEP